MFASATTSVLLDIEMKARAWTGRLILFQILAVVFAASAFPQENLRIRKIEVQGNLRVEEDGIRLHLKAQPGEPFDAETVNQDIKAIYRMGFFDDVKAEVSPDGTLTYTVKERPYVKDVAIEGNVKVKTDQIESVLGVRPRTILDRGKLQEGIERVRRLYGEQGYVNAVVDYSVAAVENNQANVLLEIEEGKLLLIKDIVFEGNHTFSDSELRDVMATKEDWIIPFTTRGVLDREVLTNDVAVLSSFYTDHGFIENRIDEPIILRTQKGLKVVIRISEGERYRVGKVRIGGDLIDDPGKLLEKVELTAGQIFRGSRLRQDMTTLSERYANSGFAFAKVEPAIKIQHESRLVDVDLIIKRGPPVYFDQVKIAGNTKTRDKVIRRELYVAEKDRFSSNKIKESRNALQRTGYFKDVQVTTQKRDEPGIVDLLVDVEEGPTGTFSIGAGFSTASGFTFNAAISEQNLFGTGRKLAANVELGSIDQDFVLGFTEPHFLGSRFDLGLDALKTESEFEDFTTDKAGFGVRASGALKYLRLPFIGRYADRSEGDDFEYEQKTSIMDHLRGGLAYSFSRDEIKDVGDNASNSIKQEEGTSFTSAITPSLALDTRDHAFAPTEGTKSSIALKLAGLGGDNQFIKSDNQVRWYYPVFQNYKWGKNFAVMLGGNLGYGFAWARSNGSSELPLFERYFPGGTNSVRGFEQRSLGPRECTKTEVKNGKEKCTKTEVVGGDKQLVLNAELHFPLLEKWGLRGFTFFDQGQAFRESETINLADLRRSVGIGAFWMSPFGPLKVSLGFPLNEERFDQTELIGFSFGGGGGQ